MTPTALLPLLRRAQGAACAELRRRPDWSPARDLDVCACGATLAQHRIREAADMIERLLAIVRMEPLLMEAICPHCQNSYTAEMDVPHPIGVLTATGSETHEQIRLERDALRAERAAQETTR